MLSRVPTPFAALRDVPPSLKLVKVIFSRPLIIGLCNKHPRSTRTGDRLAATCIGRYDDLPGCLPSLEGFHGMMEVALQGAASRPETGQSTEAEEAYDGAEKGKRDQV